MRFLITGASGLLGAHLAAALDGHSVTGTDRHPWWGDRPIDFVVGDLSSPGFAESTVSAVAPDVLIHCAGLVNVERCEAEPTLAYATNADITGRLAGAMAPHGVFVYVTTDGIFKGDQSFADESWLPCPRTVYGRSKLHGEWETQIATDRHLILRTNFYGWSSGRKVTAGEWLYEALQQGQAVTLFNDFYFTPLYVVDLVQRILALIQAEHLGIFHVGGRDRISKHDFGVRMAACAGFSQEGIRSGTIRDATLRAQRPRDMSLNSTLLHETIGLPLVGCDEGLRRFVEDRSTPLSIRFSSTRPTVSR